MIDASELCVSHVVSTWLGVGSHRNGILLVPLHAGTSTSLLFLRASACIVGMSHLTALQLAAIAVWEAFRTRVAARSEGPSAPQPCQRSSGQPHTARRVTWGWQRPRPAPGGPPSRHVRLVSPIHGVLAAAPSGEDEAMNPSQVAARFVKPITLRHGHSFYQKFVRWLMDRGQTPRKSKRVDVSPRS